METNLKHHFKVVNVIVFQRSKIPKVLYQCYQYNYYWCYPIWIKEQRLASSSKWHSAIKRSIPMKMQTYILSSFNQRGYWLMTLSHLYRSLSLAVIYHYCVIMEMFCIGLYARHTFRKVEPKSLVEDVEGSLGIWQMEKAVQTDDVQMTPHKPIVLSEDAWPSLARTDNPTYTSASEDSLCVIEHAPLDGFPFPQSKGQHSGRPQPMEHNHEDAPDADLTHITVRAEINYQASKDVTIVWSVLVGRPLAKHWIQHNHCRGWHRLRPV